MATFRIPNFYDRFADRRHMRFLLLVESTPYYIQRASRPESAPIRDQMLKMKPVAERIAEWVDQRGGVWQALSWPPVHDGVSVRHEDYAEGRRRALNADWSAILVFGDDLHSTVVRAMGLGQSTWDNLVLECPQSIEAADIHAALWATRHGGRQLLSQVMRMRKSQCGPTKLEF